MRRVVRGAATGIFALALGVGGGCGTTEIPVLLAVDSRPGSMDSGIEGQFDASGLASGPDAQASGLDALSPGAPQEYCKGSGPPVLVMTTDAGTVSTCPDQLAQRAFRYALCVCENYTSDHALVTDAFDGTQGPYDASRTTAGGSVGVNGDFHPGQIRIGGSVWASNPSTSITTASSMQISGELHAQGELLPSSTLIVQADAWMAGGIYTGGSAPVNVTVGGTLHLPAMAPANVSGTFTHGAIDPTPFNVPAACDCDATQFVDVAGVVRTYQTQNDDAAMHLDATMLENVTSALTTTLPCGRIFFKSIGANAPIHLMTSPGRVAIFVAGDLSASDFEIDVPQGAELDLFVAGSVNVRGVFLVGDQTNPARARTYVGGSTVNLQSAATLAGNLYAPNATITLGGTAPTTLYGAIFSAALSSGSDLTIHYDKTILTPSFAPTCAVPTSCSTCNDCNGQACNSGTCGHCADSTQCCAPLVCRSGTCVADVIPR
jgi:hypothetical protein